MEGQTGTDNAAMVGEKSEAVAGVIHAIGDSHACVFAGQDGLQAVWPERGVNNLTGVRAWHLGPYLAHSFANGRHEVRRKFGEVSRGFARGDRVLLCFGEIDCRCHVVKQGKRGGIARAAASLAERYIEAAARVRDRLRLRLGVWGVVPPPPTQIADHPFATSGTFDERREAACAFNAALVRYGGESGVAVVCAHDGLLLPDGSRDESLFCDEIHLGQGALPQVRRALAAAGWIDSASSVLRHVRAELVAGGRDGSAAIPATALPATVQSALIDRAALECAVLGLRRVALIGAGAHVRRVTLAPFERRGLKVEAILDDRAKMKKLLGVPVVALERLPRGVQAVIPCSDAHERVLLARARQVFGQRRVRVVPVYTYCGLV